MISQEGPHPSDPPLAPRRCDPHGGASVCFLPQASRWVTPRFFTLYALFVATAYLHVVHRFWAERYFGSYGHWAPYYAKVRKPTARGQPSKERRCNGSSLLWG